MCLAIALALAFQLDGSPPAPQGSCSPGDIIVTSGSMERRLIANFLDRSSLSWLTGCWVIRLRFRVHGSNTVIVWGSCVLLTTLLEAAPAVIESDTSPSLCQCSVAPEACIAVADGCTLDSDLSKKIKQTTGNQAKWIPPFTLKGERGREGLEEDALIDVLGDSPVSPLRIARLVSIEWIARSC